MDPCLAPSNLDFLRQLASVSRCWRVLLTPSPRRPLLAWLAPALRFTRPVTPTGESADRFTSRTITRRIMPAGPIAPCLMAEATRSANCSGFTPRPCGRPACARN